METPSLTAAVRRELLTHPEVTEAAHRFGGIVFHLGGREPGTCTARPADRRRRATWREILSLPSRPILRRRGRRR